MTRYLLTQTLLNSWLWTLKDNPFETADDEPKASKMDEFMQTLRREPIPTNEAMQNGIDLENLVTQSLQGAPNTSHKWYEAAADIAERIKGSLLQFRASKQAEIRGLPLLLYGKFDALKAGVVYDIKYSKNYDVGKYIDSIQHPMYLELCPEAFEFTYLISNGNNVFSETYRRDETESIIPTIEQFLGWLETQSLMSEYKKHWGSLCVEGS